MNKERLEDIKVRFSKASIFADTKDIQWLIEQAERVEELETELQKDVIKEWGLMEQNKHYREALESIADETYLFANPDYKQEFEALMEIARKALEESE